MQVRSTPPLKDVTLTEYDCYCSLRYVFSLTLHDVMLIKIGNTEKLPLTSLLSGLQSQFYLMHAQLPKYFKYSLCILKNVLIKYSSLWQQKLSQT